MSPPPGSRALVFDWEGPYGHFRKPYSAASPVTFPLPPPTAVAGLIGAIAGWPRDEYWTRLGEDCWGVAVRSLRPVRRLRAGVNLLILKGCAGLRPPVTPVHRPTPMEFLVEPAFRIVFWHQDAALLTDLRTLLADQKTLFTPSLGLAGCIANLTFHGEHAIQPVAGGDWVESPFVLDEEELERFDVSDGARVVRLTLPARMCGDRRVVRYCKAVLDEGAGPIRFVPREAHRVADEIVQFL